jgi:rare lipoprotein A
MKKCTTIIIATLLLSSCATSTKHDGMPRDHHKFDATKIPNPIPKTEPKSRYGNPSSYVVLGKRYSVLKTAYCYHETGVASWYGTKFHKRLTSNREQYDMYAMTAANKVLPLPSYVRVHNLENGKTIIVRVNDRGPFHPNRIVDLSFAAAAKLGMTDKGTALVEVDAIDPNHSNQSCGKPLSDAVPTHTPELYLQLGAFTLKANAQQLAKKVKQYTHRPVHIISVEMPSNTIYKVQIGPLKNVEQADDLTYDLQSAGFGEVFTAVR